MQQRISRLLIAAALVAAAHTLLADQRASWTTGVDQIFSAWNRPDSPGCAVGVFAYGAIVYERGYGMADLEQDVPIARILTRAAFENAIRVNGAIGGSTNAVIHLIAIARRIGVDLDLDDWDRLGRAIAIK